MPKTYPDSKKKQWLKQLEQGVSLKQIASKAKCDERTVKRAVQELQSSHAAREALTQLYQEALRSHMDKLNEALDIVIEGLNLPDVYSTEMAWSQIAQSQTFSQQDRVTEAKETKVLGHGDDDAFSDNALLAEHLRNGKALRALADWYRIHKKHRAACGQLQIKVFALLSEVTGLKTRAKGDVTTTPFLHAENAGDLLCRTAIQYLSANKDTSGFGKEIVAHSERGEIQHRTTVLVEGLKDACKLSDCKAGILKSLKVLKESPEATEVLNTFQQLEKILPKARNELRAIRLLGVLPGQCRLCRQFGL